MWGQQCLSPLVPGQRYLGPVRSSLSTSDPIGAPVLAGPFPLWRGTWGHSRNRNVLALAPFINQDQHSAEVWEERGESRNLESSAL